MSIAPSAPLSVSPAEFGRHFAQALQRSHTQDTHAVLDEVLCLYTPTIEPRPVMPCASKKCHAYLPVAVFVVHILDAIQVCPHSSNATRDAVIAVLRRFTDDTGFKFSHEPVARNSKYTELVERMYPYTLRLCLRGFLVSFLEAMHGALWDGSAHAATVRSLVDKFLDFATIDTRETSKLRVDPPPGSGQGMAKVAALVSLFPMWVRMTNTILGPDDESDPVLITAPLAWNAAKVQALEQFAVQFLDAEFATGHRRHSETSAQTYKLFSLTQANLEYFSHGIQLLLQHKNAFRFTKIIPPCPKGRAALLHSELRLLFKTFPGGNHKTGKLYNPFGGGKGYDASVQRTYAARSRKKRLDQKCKPVPPEVAAAAQKKTPRRSHAVEPPTIAVKAKENPTPSSRPPQPPEPTNVFARMRRKLKQVAHVKRAAPPANNTAVVKGVQISSPTKPKKKSKQKKRVVAHVQRAAPPTMDAAIADLVTTKFKRSKPKKKSKKPKSKKTLVSTVHAQDQDMDIFEKIRASIRQAEMLCK